MLIRVGHSPDSDDAFMFHALSNGKLETGQYRFTHELVDIETLNHRAFHGELELTAVSVHAYAYLNDVYALCNCGASMGDKYGPILVAKPNVTASNLRRIAVPGTLTTAYLALSLWLHSQNLKVGEQVELVTVPFDTIMEEVIAGNYDAGIIIHEGQLTYKRHGLEAIVDTGVWWMNETGLPLPLGANAIRKDLPGNAITDVVKLLYKSISYGLEHRQEALDYAMKYGRGLERADADEFVGMYVNDWTLDFKETGRQSVKELLKRAYEAGVVPKLVVPEFVGV
ncbi:MAG: ABC transporter substrate-binding protein [Planctomycetaceae bacterium]|nr:ABC transporter substrate-binding protein [Planctomycetaceae bacterium]